MGKTLPPDQLQLYNGIDEVLWKDWDPCGVSGHQGARDEYYSYLPEAFRLVMENATPAVIAQYLDDITTHRMGMLSNLKRSREIAEKLLSLRRVLQ